MNLSLAARAPGARPRLARALLVAALAASGLVASRARADDDAVAATLAKIHALEWSRDPALEHLLGPDDDTFRHSPEVRRALARALGRIAAPGDDVAAAESGRITTLLVERLSKERDDSVRREILLALGQAGTPEAARALVHARDAEPPPGKVAGVDEERIAAATALRFAATDDDRADLIRGLKDVLPEVRRDSALALGVLEKKRHARGIATIDTDTRAALLTKLDERAAPSLHRALEATFAYVYALGSLADPSRESRAALAWVVETFDDPDIRAEAARGLARSAIGAVASEAAPPALFLDTQDARVATEVVHALAKHRSDPNAVKRIVDAYVDHGSFHARRAACEALAAPIACGAADLVNAAVDALLVCKTVERESESVRAAALQALARRRPDHGLEAALVHANLFPTTQARVSSAEALGVLLSCKDTADAARTALEKLVRTDKDHRVRMAALGALGESDDAAASLPLALELLSKEEDAGVLETALDLVSKSLATDPRCEPAFARCYERVREKRELSEAREGLASALGDVGSKLGDLGRKTLELAKTDPVASVAFAAAKALAQVKGEKLPEAPRRERTLAVKPRDWGGKTPVLLFETNRGTFEVELYPDDAPLHCANVWELAEKHFYDGLGWHRVVSSFVIQGGDPRGDGTGDPGYTIPDELSARPYVRGTLGMPKSAVKDTGGCQLFFTHGRTPHLDGRYTVFGQIRKGVDTIDLIEEGDTIVSVRTKLE